MKIAADRDMEEKDTDTTEKGTTQDDIMEKATTKAAVTDVAVEDTTEDVHADITSALVVNTADGENSSPRERRSKS